MWHHSSGDYREAASRAAKVGREKMEKIIHDGQVSAEAVVSQIQNSYIHDRIAPASKVRLIAREDGTGFDLATVEPDATGFGWASSDANRLHPHAFSRVMAATGLGMEFVNTVNKRSGGEDWGSALIERAVNDILAHDKKNRHLIRVDSDDNRVKGFLSDSYRRFDSRPLADAFMRLSVATGLVPIEGVASDTKCRIRAVLPKVFEPIRDEVMIFGLEFGTSDYGDGGVVMNLWTMRMMCTNLAVTQKGLRQVHAGKRLPDDLRLSAAVYEQDAKTLSMILEEVGQQMIGPAAVEQMLDRVSAADEEEIRSADGIDKYLKGLGKTEAQTVKALYEGHDVQNLPQGQTVYRLSNAVSFFAQSKGIGADRKIELQEHAGRILHPNQVAKTARDY